MSYGINSMATVHSILVQSIWTYQFSEMSGELSSQKILQNNDGTYANSPSIQLGDIYMGQQGIILTKKLTKQWWDICKFTQYSIFSLRRRNNMHLDSYNYKICIRQREFTYVGVTSPMNIRGIPHGNQTRSRALMLADSRLRSFLDLCGFKSCWPWVIIARGGTTFLYRARWGKLKGNASVWSTSHFRINARRATPSVSPL
jgi:hypothetical protein